MSIEHDPLREAAYLKQCLSEHGRPIGFLLAAGCPQSIKDEKGKPLIPAIDALTEGISLEMAKTDEADAFAKVVANLKADETAGISAYSWRDHAVGISLGGGKIFVWRREDGKQIETGSVAIPKNMTAVQLRIKAVGGEKFNFAYSIDGKNWLAAFDQIKIGGLDGARIALIDDSRTPNAGARFDWLRVTGN